MKKSLKTYIKSIFPLGKNELGYDILGLVAKKEGLVEYQIVNHLARGTRRTVNNSIKNFLIPYDFLYKIESVESQRNVKNAFGKGKEIKPKKYYLTFKGFVVSLVNVRLQDNYIMKKYIDFFPEELRNDALEYITNEIFIYVFYNYFVGIILNNVNDLVFHIDDTTPRWDILEIDNDKKEKMKELEEKQDQLSEKLIKDNNDLFYLIEYWSRAIELLTKQTDKQKLIDKLVKESIWYKIEESGFYEKYNIKPTEKLSIRKINKLSSLP